MSSQEVFRDNIKEGRGSYFVEYQPADARQSFVTLELVFPKDNVSKAEISRFMKVELEHWLRRYPVPVMVMAFDATESLIHLSDESGKSHLKGYIHPKTHSIVREWGILRESELPVEQTNADYLGGIYQDVPYRIKDDVQKEAIRKARLTNRTIKIIVILMRNNQLKH